MSDLTRHLKLQETSELMFSEDRKERFIAEYYQLLYRFNRLGESIGLYYEARLADKPIKLDCPIELLEMQYNTMDKLLNILVIRAEIEDITL